jgi:hypothetical protein
MRKQFFTMLMVSAMVMGLILSGCSGGGGVGSTPSNTSQTVMGVAASGAPIVGTVTLKDASPTPLVRTTASAANGSFSINVGGLTPPYMLSVTWTTSSGVNKLYSFAAGPGTANINPFSNAVFAASGGVSDTATFSGTPSLAMLRDEVSRTWSTSNQLQTQLSPLFEQYGTTQNPISDEYVANNTGLDAMFDDVNITVSNGIITVTNRETGAVIFTAPINNIPSGTFNDYNTPGGTGTVDGASLYTNDCSKCHGPLATSTKLGVTAAQIQSAITSVYQMNSLTNLSALQIQAIASALSSTPVSTPTPTPTPAPACTYTYNTGACQSNGMQTLTVATALPAGCTGTPLTSQACTYTPPPACTYTYNTLGTCSSSGQQAVTVATALPAGCIGTPATFQPCTYTAPPQPCTYTYNTVGSCPSTGQQAVTVASATPAGCTGTPATFQPCTYIAPTCTYTYNTGACQSNNTQTLTVATALPVGCTGTPLTSQACVYTPPVSAVTLAQVTASCTMCHGLTVNTTVLKSGGYTVTGRTAANWLTTVNTMVGYGASLASGTTAQDYANFLATLP